MASGGGESRSSCGHMKLSIGGEGIVWKFLIKMIIKKKKENAKGNASFTVSNLQIDETINVISDFNHS